MGSVYVACKYLLFLKGFLSHIHEKSLIINYSPDSTIDAILRKKDTISDLTIVSNNAGVDGKGLGKLLNSGQVSQAIVSYIGENKFFENLYSSGKITLQLTPQGTIAERIKAAASGVPAFYTPAALNTAVEYGELPIRYNSDGTVKTYSETKETRIFNGKKYLLEHALPGDVSIVKVHKADRLGNAVFHSTAHNFNGVMARASTRTIVEADEIVEVGELGPNEIAVPGIYVDYVFKTTNPRQFERLEFAKDDSKLEHHEINDMSKKEKIARRAALEFEEGMYVNLGIGVPIMAASYVDKSIDIQLQSENGVLGLGGLPRPGEEDPDTISAGKAAATLTPGASVFGSEESFAMIRSGRMDMAMLGAMQVSRKGDLANWFLPGKVKGMGGAMDLVANPDKTRVVVCCDHTDKAGNPKIMEECDLPLTGKQVVSRIITDMAVFDVNHATGLILKEIAPGLTVEDIKKSTGCSFDVCPDLKIIEYA